MHHSNQQPRQQLSKGMEHLRSYVTVSEYPENETRTAWEQSKSNGVDNLSTPEPTPRPTTPQRPENPQNRRDPFQFGTRYLEDGDDIFSHNAWDHVEIDSQYRSFIEEQTAFQRANQVSEFDKQRFNSRPEKWWDKFYSNNQANFFKDRKWLVQEFPALGVITRQNHGPATILEVGAGAGNTAFPLLAMNKNPQLRVHACDYSQSAIDVIRAQDAYKSQAVPVLQADVWDLASDSPPSGLQSGSVDLVLMIFIFSALAPCQWPQAVRNIFSLLKPGGEVLFRDYGRGDLAQVRFKKGRYLDENFYVRGDGTRVYFFEESELRQIWGHRSIPGSYPKSRRGNGNTTLEKPSLEIIDLATDRRMLVNRQRKLKMYRCWMQGRFRKSASGPTGDMAEGV